MKLVMVPARLQDKQWVQKNWIPTTNETNDYWTNLTKSNANKVRKSKFQIIFFLLL